MIQSQAPPYLCFLRSILVPVVASSGPLGSRYESLECKRFIGGTSCEIREGKKQDWAGNATDHNADLTLVNRKKLNRKLEKGESQITRQMWQNLISNVRMLRDSVLGPSLFSCFTYSLDKLFRSHGFKYHLYPTSKERWLRGRRSAERRYSTFKVRRGRPRPR